MTMKKSTLLVTIACGTILFSCNSNTGKKSSEKKTSELTDNSSSIQDSIKKADELEYQEARQDSIDALQIKGYSVKKLSGKHKYGGVTKIEYKSLKDELKKIDSEHPEIIAAKEKLMEKTKMVNIVEENLITNKTFNIISDLKKDNKNKYKKK